MQIRTPLKFRNITAILLALFMITGLVPTGTQTAKADSVSTLSNPRILADSSMEAGQKTTYDCIYFGSYPQTEIVAKASDCGTYGRTFYKTTDCVADESLYNRLSAATGWDANGDITIDGTKYRRIQQSDASYVFPNKEVGLYTDYYWWYNSSAVYHYFRYDPIKWRVLQVDGNQAFLLADLSLDAQYFYPEETEVRWAQSTIRSWLNGYEASENSYGTDYSDKNFIDAAFTLKEQQVIINSEVNNTTSSYYCKMYPSVDTIDKIFLLADYDVSGKTDECIRYGFASTLYDEARATKSSIYAQAMGAYVEDSSGTHLGNGNWWLRSPEYSATSASAVRRLSNMQGYYVNEEYCVRPALNIDLSSSLWTPAGTVCTDGTVVEDTSKVSQHVWDEGTVYKEPNCTETGRVKYTCTDCGAVMYEVTATDPDNHPESEQITEKAIAPTCTQSGKTEQITCNLCKKVLKESTTVAALGHDKVIDIPEVPVTCRTSGYSEQSHCSRCEEILSERKEIPSPGHQEVTVKGTPATCTVDGTTDSVCCANCDKVFSESEEIPRINKIKISYSTAVYDGKIKSPTVKIYDREGNQLANKTDYTLSTPSGRKNVGTYTYKITFKGNYSGTEKLTLTINPKGTTISKLTALTKSFKVTWKKNSTQTSGYQLQYSTSSAFKNAKTVTVSGTSTTSKTIKSLKAKTKYYVRIRTYKTVSGKKYYSAWSAKKYVKTK